MSGIENAAQFLICPLRRYPLHRSAKLLGLSMIRKIAAVVAFDVDKGRGNLLSQDVECGRLPHPFSGEMIATSANAQSTESCGVYDQRAKVSAAASR